MKKLLYSAALALLSSNAMAQPCSTPNLIAHWDFDSLFVGDNGFVDNVNGWTCVWPHTYQPTMTGATGIPHTAIWLNGGNDLLQVPFNSAMDVSSFTLQAVVSFHEYLYDNAGVCIPNYAIWFGDPITRTPIIGQSNFGLYANSSAPGCTMISPGKPKVEFVYAGLKPGTPPFPDLNWWTGSVATQPYIPFHPIPGLPSPWQCVTVMYDANTEIMDLYVDGIHYVSEHWPNATATATRDLFIGGYGPSSTSGVVAFHFDDIKIYDGVFTCPQNVTNLCATVPCTTPPIAIWNFNGNADDSISGAGPINAAPPSTYVNGVSGVANTALHFNGSDYLQYASTTTMDLTDWTISAIVRPTDFDPQGAGKSSCEVGTVLWRGSQGSSQHYSLVYTDNAYDSKCGIPVNPNFNVFSAAAAAPNPTTNPDWNIPPYLVAGSWYCVTARYDATAEEISLFLDGTHVVTLPYANSYSYPLGSVADIFIGKSNMPAPWQYFFNGDIDDIRLYNFVLPEECMPVCPQRGEGKTTAISNVNSIKSFRIVPNPANNQFAIELEGYSGKANYTVTNSFGAIARRGTADGKTTNVDVSDLPSGLYIISIQNGSDIKTQRLMIEH